MSPLPDEYMPPDIMPASGRVARIVSYDGYGEYTITEQVYSIYQDAWEDAVSPVGAVGVTAYEMNGSTGVPEGERVLFWEDLDSDSYALHVFMASGGGSFWARITGNAASGTHRWTYSWVEVEKTIAGYGGWTTLSGGRSGSTAYNTIEDMNTGADAHVEGNGVDPANLDPAVTGSDTFAFMPCSTDNVVRMWPVQVGSAIEYWFAYETGVDGACS